MGDHEAINRSSHPSLRSKLGSSSAWPESMFLAIGTFGHGQNQSATAISLSDTIDITSHSILLECIGKALKEECKHIEEAEEALSQEKSLTKEQELQKHMIRMSLEKRLRTSTADATHYCSFQERSSWTELVRLAMSEEKERYLCISDGFMIYCMDLKSKDETLPKTFTLDLLDKGLPASTGLFKFGSGTYMMSGQKFPNIDKHEHEEDGGNFLQWLYEKYGFEGTSHETYHLTGCDGRLSLSKCDNIPPLKKPKFWPIVERIGDELHVMESIPDMLLYPPHSLPSHEVLNLNEVGRGWMEVPPLHHPKDKTRGLLIVNHIVVGDQMYALLDGLRECFVFDCKSKKWEGLGDQQLSKHVGSLLYHGKGICSGQVLSPGSPDYPVYIVIGIGDGNVNKIASAAHLVDKVGEIVHTWELPNLLGGLREPCMMMEASLFRVEEGTNHICAVVIGCDRVTEDYFLCISTFTVEHEAVTNKPPSPNSVLSPYALCHSDDDSDDADAELKPKYNNLRPKVVVKWSRLYQLHNPDLGAGNADYFPPRLSACFL